MSADETAVSAEKGADEVVDAPREAPAAPEKKTRSPRSSGAKVTNRSGGRLAIKGVTIEDGESATVPNLNKNQGVIKAWIDAGVIELG